MFEKGPLENVPCTLSFLNSVFELVDVRIEVYFSIHILMEYLIPLTLPFEPHNVPFHHYNWHIVRQFNPLSNVYDCLLIKIFEVLTVYSPIRLVQQLNSIASFTGIFANLGDSCCGILGPLLIPVIIPVQVLIPEMAAPFV